MYKDKTPEQQQNFKTLLDGLVDMYGDKRHDDHFKMDEFQAIKVGISAVRPSNAFTQHDCGTSACLLGHGPIFGIIDDRDLEMNWTAYALEFFGASQSVADGEWDFLFSPGWSNDIQEAIARLRKYIDGFDSDSEKWDYRSRYSF